MSTLEQTLSVLDAFFSELAYPADRSFEKFESASMGIESGILARNAVPCPNLLSMLTVPPRRSRR